MLCSAGRIIRGGAESARVGPLFVGIAIVLILGCVVTFFEVVYNETLRHPDTSWIKFLFGTLVSVYLVIMLSFHYYKAVVVPPGSPTSPARIYPAYDHWSDFTPLPNLITRFLRRTPDNARTRNTVKVIQAAQEKAARTSTTRERPPLRELRRTCKKCALMANGQRPPKPERTHHCKVRQTCVLAFDHACPWTANTVGLQNHRYFLLFLLYFSAACLVAAGLSWKPLWLALSFGAWKYFCPKPFVLLLFVLSLVMGIAVGIMGIFQFWQMAIAETAVESYDNEYYRKLAVSRGTIWQNPYDLGVRENIRYFFNLDKFHWITIFLPVEIPPASDGWTWKKRVGWEADVLGYEDELTDEAEASEGEEFDYWL